MVREVSIRLSVFSDKNYLTNRDSAAGSETIRNNNCVINSDFQNNPLHMKTCFVCDLFAHKVHEPLLQHYGETLRD